MIRVAVEVLGVYGQLFPLWNDDEDLQEGIERLSIEFNDLPPYSKLLWRAVLQVIDVGVELLHQCHINLFFW